MAKKIITPWKSKIIGFDEVSPDQLLGHELNPKVHSHKQQRRIEAAISEVGFLSPVLVNANTQKVLDGHARIGIAISRNEPTIPVIYLNLTEAEEKLVLATFDSVGGLAKVDKNVFDELLHDIDTGNAELQKHLAEMAQSAGIIPFDAQPESDFSKQMAADQQALSEEVERVAAELDQMPDPGREWVIRLPSELYDESVECAEFIAKAEGFTSIGEAVHEALIFKTRFTTVKE